MKANMVERPEDYAWSSYAHNAWGDASELITPHDCYVALSSEHETRLANYRCLFAEELTDDFVTQIRRAAYYNQPIGDDKFKLQIEKKLGRSLGHMKSGRPKKSD